jgi:hypothetical protein
VLTSAKQDVTHTLKSCVNTYFKVISSKTSDSMTIKHFHLAYIENVPYRIFVINSCNDSFSFLRSLV